MPIPHALHTPNTLGSPVSSSASIAHSKAGFTAPLSAATMIASSATGGVTATNANAPLVSTATSREQLKQMTSIVEAAGLSQVVANLTSGLFSSAQLPPNLVTTLTQAGSLGSLQVPGALPSSSVASNVSDSVSSNSIGSTGVNTASTIGIMNPDRSIITTIGSTGANVQRLLQTPRNISQVQTISGNTSAVSVSSSSAFSVNDPATSNI